MSPRAAIALLQASRAWAMLEGRDHLIPEDVQAVLIPVISHRLRPIKSINNMSHPNRELLQELILTIAV